MSENMELVDNTKPAQIVAIDGIEYNANDFNEQQSMLLQHIVDLDRKLSSNRFSGDQLQVGRDAFFNMLKQALEPVAE